MPAADTEPAAGSSATFASAAPSSHPSGERAVTVLWSFGKCLGALLPVYLAGYYGFSIALVLFGLMIYIGWKHSRLDKVMRLRSAVYLMENEREFTTESVFRAKRDLPPWVRTRFMLLQVFYSSSVTSVRLNLCCTTAASRHCCRRLRAYSSLVGTCCFFRGVILLNSKSVYFQGLFSPTSRSS